MNKVQKIIIFSLLVFIGLTFLVNLAVAFEPLKNPLNIEIKSPAQVYELIGRVSQAILGLVGSAVFVMFIYGGITWLLSGGAEEKIKKARGTLVWSLFGLLIIFTSYALLSFTIRYITIATGVSTEAFSDSGSDQPGPPAGGQ
ncbi:MAG: hypothetical protein WC480_01350 [Patescibacteria group bacterium]